MSDVRIFMSFDIDNDGDLHDALLEQSLRGASGFEISARTQAGTMTDNWGESARRRISDSDEVIIICGELTSESPRVSAELRMAQEEEKPYFLLWGRRETMCTKPVGARPADGMYSWTWEILQNQIGQTLRTGQPLEVPERCKRP